MFIGKIEESLSFYLSNFCLGQIGNAICKPDRNKNQIQPCNTWTYNTILSKITTIFVCCWSWQRYDACKENFYYQIVQFILI